MGWGINSCNKQAAVRGAVMPNHHNKSHRALLFSSLHYFLNRCLQKREWTKQIVLEKNNNNQQHGLPQVCSVSQHAAINFPPTDVNGRRSRRERTHRRLEPLPSRRFAFCHRRERRTRGPDRFLKGAAAVAAAHNNHCLR